MNKENLTKYGLKINPDVLKKVMENDGECICKENVHCPCNEPLLIATGTIEKEHCTCKLFYKAEQP